MKNAIALAAVVVLVVGYSGASPGCAVGDSSAVTEERCNDYVERSTGLGYDDGTVGRVETKGVERTPTGF